MSEYKKPLSDVYFFWLERALKAFRSKKAQVFKELGVNVTSDQWMVIKRTHEEPGINQIELAQSIYKDPASITRIIDILVTRDLVERKKHPSDRRNYCIYLTADGEKLVERVLPVAIDMRKQGLANISEEEQLQLKNILDRITQNLKQS